MMTKIMSTFHPTWAAVRPGPGGELSPRQMARIEKKLCGCSDCRCGGIGRSEIAGGGGRIERLRGGAGQIVEVK